ncbi:predicted protein [Naegleria gruberi]|uniref:Predicted protein n=1 Tax=Naegleria gruberi TaxID=5762 RepID=D2VSA4_NAEGR|nr:uncharacterized protein NAEGRDRAFT_71870 [Naegleria gruberi]EFC40389.1 predicted protein [Naegleria gruberi]|eukprot:XP_002673133.1 predicted protein [Naegleria gruberi strain NEG-M]
MLDGVIITDDFFKVLFARKSPTILSALSTSFQQKQLSESDDVGLLGSFSKPTSYSPKKRSSMSTTMMMAQKSGGSFVGSEAALTSSIVNNDFKNQNIAWADTIVDYVRRVNKGSVPQPDGFFKVFSFMNERMIVFTRIQSVLFFVVGDEDHGELALREACKGVMEGCKAVCRKTPEDADTVIRNYGKICTLVDDILQEDGLGIGAFNSDGSTEVKRIEELTD